MLMHRVWAPKSEFWKIRNVILRLVWGMESTVLLQILQSGQDQQHSPWKQRWDVEAHSTTIPLSPDTEERGKAGEDPN